MLVNLQNDSNHITPIIAYIHSAVIGGKYIFCQRDRVCVINLVRVVCSNAEFHQPTW